MVDETNDLLVITDDGTIIRMAVSGISVYSRNTQGVRLMRPAEGSRVISIEKVDQELEEPQETAEAEAGETPDAEASQESASADETVEAPVGE